MAKETATELFLGTDHSFEFEILNIAETAAVNITGWALSMLIKRNRSDADASALVTKTTSSGITISGTYNSDPDTNTQIATATIADTDTDSINPGFGYYELKRTDAGAEAVLAYGAIDLRLAVHRS